VTGDSMEGSSTTLGKPSWRWTATRKKGP